MIAGNRNKSNLIGGFVRAALFSKPWKIRRRNVHRLEKRSAALLLYLSGVELPAAYLCGFSLGGRVKKARAAKL